MRIKSFALASAAMLLLVSSCGQKKVYDYPFQDPSLKVEDRVENLLSLLTPEEKVGLIMNKSVSVDRLGIPSYNWWSEACHGVRADGYTVYPQYIGMAATFNPDLIYDVFTSVSDEARANWNRSEREFGVGMGERFHPGNPELSFWCPNVNVKLSLDADSFSYYDGEDGLAPHSGKYQILYGSSSADKDLQALDFTLL
jgi:beta-glucosidase